MFVIGLYMALLLDLATLWPKLSTLVICFGGSSHLRTWIRGEGLGPSFLSHGKNHLVGV